MAVKIGINGLGRIGKMVLWHYVTTQPKEIEIIAANGGSGDVEDLVYMLKYDSIHGRFPAPVEKIDEETLKVGESKIKILKGRDPEQLPWGELGVDIILECTGKFTKREGASKHLKAGAKKVIISAPSKDCDKTIVLGVNQNSYNPETDHIISNASCTTNCLAPAMKVLEEVFGVEQALVTTIHAYTSSQVTIDRKKPGKHRRGRAAAVNIIPTTTGAAIATTKVIPSLAGKMNALALRVPVPDGAITDISATLKREVTAEEVNRAFEEYSKGELKGILEVSYEELVSTDILGNTHSSIIDALSTFVVNGRSVKVLAWYDNEFGYAKRLLELSQFVAERL
jgi:glyceraldehyde 3-phosphate dehydrogenase